MLLGLSYVLMLGAFVVYSFYFIYISYYIDDDDHYMMMMMMMIILYYICINSQIYITGIVNISTNTIRCLGLKGRKT